MSFEVTPTPKWRRWRELRKPIRVDTTVAVNTDIQPAFDFDAAARPTRRAELTLARRFAEFHQANPQVFARLLEFARLDAAAQRRIGVKRYFERLRGEIPTTPAPGENYRLDNGYTAFYARLLAAADPVIAAHIELRARRAE